MEDNQVKTPIIKLPTWCIVVAGVVLICMGRDTYALLGLLIAIALAAMTAHLGWMLYRRAGRNLIATQAKVHASSVLSLVFWLLFLELILMAFFRSSLYHDHVFEEIRWGEFRWRPSLDFGWLLVHRLILIMLVAIALYLIRSATQLSVFLVRHVQRVKGILLDGTENALPPVTRGIRVIAILQLLGGIYLIGHFILTLFAQIHWNTSTNFGSYEFDLIVRASLDLVLGSLLVVAAVRLLYLKLDAFWVSLLLLATHALAWSSGAVRYYYQPRLGGLLLVAFCLLIAAAFAVAAFVIWQRRIFFFRATDTLPRVTADSDR